MKVNIKLNARVQVEKKKKECFIVNEVGDDVVKVKNNMTKTRQHKTHTHQLRYTANTCN